MTRSKIKKFIALVSMLSVLAISSLVYAGTGAVLFDNAHLESIGNANWTISGGFSDFADTIKGMGYRVDENKNAKVTLDLLKKYDAFIIPEPNTKLAPEEEQAVIQYVKEGGSLYLIADHQGADRNNDGWDAVKIFNNFSEAFGVKFAEKWIKKEMPLRGKIETSDITYKVKYCGTWGGTTVDITNPAIAKGHIFLSDKNGGGAYIATSELEKGRVVALGDSSPFDDGTGDKGAVELVDGYNLLDADHRQLAINSMCYLLRKTPAENPIKIKFYYEGGKLNANPGETKEFPMVLINNTKSDYSNIVIDFYRNRPFEEKSKFNSIKLDKIAAGEKATVKLPFKLDNRSMFTLYTCVNCGSDATANIVGFNSIMVGVPMMVYIDSFHENDYVNRIKMLKNALEEDGMFYTRSKFEYSDFGLAKVDVIVMTPPKAGKKLTPEESVALINHLKKGRTVLFCAKGPDSQWGDNENLNEILKSLNIPVKYIAHPEYTSNGGKPVAYELKENQFFKLDGLTKVFGESPSALEIDETQMKKNNFAYEVISTLPGSKTPVSILIDCSKSQLGFGKIGVLGAFHFTDQSYSMDLASDTYKFIVKLLRAVSPATPAFNSSVPAQPNGAGQQTGEGAKAPQAPFIRGVAKAYAAGVLFIEDFGVKKEIKVLHGLSEEAALVEFAKFKGKLIKINIRTDISEPTIDSFGAVEYKR